jgi:type IV secretion system protein VirB1
MIGSAFLALAASCAPQIDVGTSSALVAVESGFNPYAIGVVGGALKRQPRQLAEAVTTAHALQAAGWNFSAGIGQINVRNFHWLGLTLEGAFEPCANLRAMQTILADCFDRARSRSTSVQLALRRALSCYYSGNFTTGFEHGYVHRVAAHVPRPAIEPASLTPHLKELP